MKYNAKHNTIPNMLISHYSSEIYLDHLMLSDIYLDNLC